VWDAPGGLAGGLAPAPWREQLLMQLLGYAVYHRAQDAAAAAAPKPKGKPAAAAAMTQQQQARGRGGAGRGSRVQGAAAVRLHTGLPRAPGRNTPLHCKPLRPLTPSPPPAPQPPLQTLPPHHPHL
jgi:hypothetical protein